MLKKKFLKGNARQNIISAKLNKPKSNQYIALKVN